MILTEIQRAHETASMILTGILMVIQRESSKENQKVMQRESSKENQRAIQRDSSMEKQRVIQRESSMEKQRASEMADSRELLSDSLLVERLLEQGSARESVVLSDWESDLVSDSALELLSVVLLELL